MKEVKLVLFVIDLVFCNSKWELVEEERNLEEGG
jgi:hypothetical protein